MPGDIDGLVLRHVVDEDDLVDDVVRDVGVGALKRPRRVVGGHDDDDAGAGRLGHARSIALRTAAIRGGPSHRTVIGVVRRYGQQPQTGDPAPMFDRLFGSTASRSRDRRTHPARPVPHREVPGPPLRLGAARGPRDVGLQGLRRGGQPVHAHLGAVQGAAAQAGRHGHPLRDPLVEARHDLGGRPDPGDPRAGPGPADRDARREPRRAGLHREPAAARSWTTTTSCSPTRSTASRSSPSTATRSACSSRSATSGRARSGSAAWSSSTTTSSASGSATATTTTPTPGRKSASAATELPDQRRMYALSSARARRGSPDRA